jgi:drug/metabolite transporter (DMT)-like permease
MSQLIGFFAWNKGLAIGGVARVGQVQLLQTFMTQIAAWELMGEPLTLRSIAFAFVVAACVWFGKRTQIKTI